MKDHCGHRLSIFQLKKGIIDKYTCNNNLEESEFQTEDANTNIKFSKNANDSKKMMLLLIKLKRNEAYITRLMKVYIIIRKVPFILGLNTMNRWNINIGIKISENKKNVDGKSVNVWAVNYLKYLYENKSM